MIVIKTMMNLPDHCYECPCHDGESGYCQADKEHRYSDYRPFWCPLVKEDAEVTPQSCDELDFIQPHKKVSVNLDLCTDADVLDKIKEGVSEYDKDHIWYKGSQYISLRRFLEVKAEIEDKVSHIISDHPLDGYEDGQLILKTIQDTQPVTPKRGLRRKGGIIDET